MGPVYNNNGLVFGYLCTESAGHWAVAPWAGPADNYLDLYILKICIGLNIIFIFNIYEYIYWTMGL